MIKYIKKLIKIIKKEKLLRKYKKAIIIGTGLISYPRPDYI